MLPATQCFTAVALAFLSLSHPSTAQSIRWVNCSENVPPSAGLDGVDIGNLPPTLRCGKIDVPMDYSKCLSANNTITLGLAMHRPASPKGVIFINAGGSDPNAIIAWNIALNQTSAFSGLLDYDLMMMDLRGTYSSNPLNVSLDVFGAIPATFPQNQSEFDTLQQASAAFIQSWIDNSSPPGIIQYVGTRQVVKDYEQIRRALGYDKIHFLGMSYGSYRAQQYALAFPNRVDHFALDAVVPYGMSLFDEAQYQINVLNRALFRADAYCLNNSTCPFHGQGRGIVPKTVKNILKAVEQAESSCKSNCSDIISSVAVRAALFSVFQGLPDFPMILGALAEAKDGNFSGALASPPRSVDAIVAVPLQCGDIAFNELNYSDFKTSLDGGLAHDNTGIGMTITWQLQLYCSGWPFPVTPEVNKPNQHKMLFVGADFDNNAPVEWTTYSWGNANRSGLVIRHGDDHVTFWLPDQPSNDLTKEFLRTGILPLPRNETLMTVYSPGMHLQPVEDPYGVPTGSSAGDVDSDSSKLD